MTGQGLSFPWPVWLQLELLSKSSVPEPSSHTDKASIPVTGTTYSERLLPRVCCFWAVFLSVCDTDPQCDFSDASWVKLLDDNEDWANNVKSHFPSFLCRLQCVTTHLPLFISFYGLCPPVKWGKYIFTL